VIRGGWQVHTSAAVRMTATAGAKSKTWTFPVQVRRPSSQEAWDTAVRLAGGDVRRLAVGQDGSVTVLNQPRGSHH
jgi:hypothetical protein